MTTNAKSSRTSRKGRKVSRVVNAVELQQVTNNISVASPSGSGVGASGASEIIGLSSVVSGAAASHGGENVTTSYNKVRNTYASQLAAAVEMESESISIIELRTKIASHWSAPRFELSSDYSAVVSAVASLPNDLKERAINGARLAWLARPENAATTATISEIVDTINSEHAKDFERVCGCACPAASDVRLWVRSSLNLSTINETSKESDYITGSLVPSGLSVTGLVSVIMSVHKRNAVVMALAAAVAAAKSDYFESLDNCLRRAVRLGRPLDSVVNDVRERYQIVTTSNEKELARLRKNLASCWAAVRRIENNIVLASPVGAFGALEDCAGGWCFPASLPASGVSAKVRKLWENRKKVLSSINTLETLISLAS